MSLNKNATVPLGSSAICAATPNHRRLMNLATVMLGKCRT
jgi:hypothetical protein